MKFLKEIFFLIINRCPKCGEHLCCASDNLFGYGLWYCPKCDGEIEAPIKDRGSV
jgi:hypothetical protein